MCIDEMQNFFYIKEIRFQCDFIGRFLGTYFVGDTTANDIKY